MSGTELPISLRDDRLSEIDFLIESLRRKKECIRTTMEDIDDRVAELEKERSGLSEAAVDA